jgi:hypothetical protein
LGSLVICIDEKPGMQACERRHPSRAAAAGRAARYEFEYKRHGTQTLIAGLVVHTGEVLASCGDTRTGADLVAFLEQMAVRFPLITVHVIWDNLNIHFDGREDRWSKFNERHGHRFFFFFFFHYTPKHASWVNQVEIFFSISNPLRSSRNPET